MMKTLFLNPPSFDGFDGAAGARYQARREIRSFWFPTWLAQVAAMVPDSKLIDAPPAGLTLEDVLPQAADYEIAVLYTSSPSFESDAKTAAALKEVNPKLKVGMDQLDEDSPPLLPFAVQIVLDRGVLALLPRLLKPGGNLLPSGGPVVENRCSRMVFFRHSQSRKQSNFRGGQTLGNFDQDFLGGGAGAGAGRCGL